MSVWRKVRLRFTGAQVGELQYRTRVALPLLFEGTILCNGVIERT